MPQSNQRVAGWRGVSLVAITYVYFLIFAQFAFLKRLTELSIADAHLKAVMAAMAFGGILFSLLTPRTNLLRSPRLRLQAGLALCAAAALLTLPASRLPSSSAAGWASSPSPSSRTCVHGWELGALSSRSASAPASAISSATSHRSSRPHQPRKRSPLQRCVLRPSRSPQRPPRTLPPRARRPCNRRSLFLKC